MLAKLVQADVIKLAPVILTWLLWDPHRYCIRFLIAQGFHFSPALPRYPLGVMPVALLKLMQK